MEGEDSIYKWVSYLEKKSLKLSETILLGETLPYFFKNKTLSENIYLAQNTSSLEKSLTIGLNWFKKVRKYSKGIEI